MMMMMMMIMYCTVPQGGGSLGAKAKPQSKTEILLAGLSMTPRLLVVVLTVSGDGSAGGGNTGWWKGEKMASGMTRSLHVYAAEVSD